MPTHMDSALSLAVLNFAYATKPVKFSDVTFPLVVAHRGGGGSIAPENTVEGMRQAVSLGLPAVEFDVRQLSDGSLYCHHDDTLDLRTTSTGNFSSLTAMGARRLVKDSSIWFGGGWPDTAVPSLNEMLDASQGLTCLFVDCKDLTDSSVRSIAGVIKDRGFIDTALLISPLLDTLASLASEGFQTVFFPLSGSGEKTAAEVAAAGVTASAVSYSDPNVASWAAALNAVGVLPLTFAVQTQAGYADQVAKGVKIIMADDPLYVGSDPSKYRRATTSHRQTGTWGHGCGFISGENGAAQAADHRGLFLGGTPGFYRWRLPIGFSQAPGEILPLPNPAGTYTMDIGVVFEGIGTDKGLGISICWGHADDFPSDTDITHSTNMARVAPDGRARLFINDAAGSGALKGTVQGTVKQVLTTTAALNAGTAYTSIPVQALTVALKTGHMFVLPSGQFVTLSAAAAVGATSISVNSVTPTTTAASGSTLNPRVLVRVVTTPSTLTISYLDEPDVGSVSFNDASWRGAYMGMMSQVASPAQISIDSITLS